MGEKPWNQLGSVVGYVGHEVDGCDALCVLTTHGTLGTAWWPEGPVGGQTRCGRVFWVYDFGHRYGQIFFQGVETP